MAKGDTTIFDEALLAMFNGTHDWDTDTFKFMFIDNTTVPTAGTATPTKGDFTHVSGGNFPATPDTVTVSLSEAAGVVTLDITTNISYAANASNPTNVYYGILYNDSATNDDAIGFVEVNASGWDATTDVTSVTWHATGLWQAQVS